MRPHRLRVTAFGAFAGPEEVRFDQLDGLFLLHGDTGAGKTTLLDAIAFALYGRVPGERGKAKRLRSDHAAPDVRTEVELEMTIGGRRLRVTRSPEWERAKKSGTGTTRTQASVRLDEATASGTWENKSTRVGEADAEIAHLMGMSAEQFFQVVLLPQGQFARFLQSEAKDRADLLQKLFGTDRFQAVERWLADRRAWTARAVEAATSELDQLMARVAQAAGASVPDPAKRLPAGDEPWQVTWAAGLLAAALAQQEAAAGVAAARRQELDVAQAALSAAGRLADRQRRRVDALGRQQALVAAAPEIEALRAELDAASRAAQVEPVLDQAARASEAAAQADKAAVQARSAIPAGTAADDAPAKVLEAAARDQEARLGRLEALRAVASQAAHEEEVAATARTWASDLDTTLSGLISASERTRAARPALELFARDAASQAAVGLPTVSARAASQRQVATDLAALVKERVVRDRAAEEHRLVTAEALALAREYERVRKARIEGMSGELAKNLVDGSPCPVCGSPDHPEPSDMPATWVTPDEEKQADEQAGKAAGKAEKASQKVAAADAMIGDLRARLTEAGANAPDDLVALTADAKAAQADAGQLEAEAARLALEAAGLGERQRQLEDLDADIADTDTKQAELTEQRASALAEADRAEQRAAVQAAELRAQLGNAGDLDGALDATRQLADVLTAAADALSAATRTAEEAAGAHDRAVQAARQADFGVTPTRAGIPVDAISVAQAAIRDAAWHQQAHARIREHDAAIAAVTTQLADPELDVNPQPAAPVTECQVHAEAALKQQEEAVAAWGQAASAAGQLAALRPQLAAALADLAPLTAGAAEARHLADLVNASTTVNQYKMTLSSFVLAARLEEVAAAASQRLLTMTAGRYSLVHTDARKGNTRADGLLACDSWTGQDRDTATLSGGETFLASLALALGLADVVTAEAAGTPMEALFVDEGFGTLDEDTLDEVMTVLDGLREGGRMVGIVSHVSELRQRIPTRIHVRKGHHGSHVSVTAG